MFPAPDTFRSTFEPSYWTRVGDWLRAVGSRRLRRTEGTPAFPADAQSLADYLAARVAAATKGEEIWASARYGIDNDTMDQRIADVAVFLMSTHTPAVPRGSFPGRYKRRFSKDEATRGGRKSTKDAYVQRRLLDLQALPSDLTVEEIAEALECSVSTVWRLRKKLKEQQREAAFQAELDALNIPAPEAAVSPAPATFDVDAALTEMDAEQAAQPREEADVERLLDTVQWLNFDNLESAYADLIDEMNAPPKPPTEHDAARLARAEAWMVQNPSYMLEGLVL